MSRKPSPETELRSVKAALKNARVLLTQRTTERDAYRVRATKAEQDAAEWRDRFDALLQRLPTKSPGTDK